MANVSVTITLPDVVYEAWQKDKKRRGVIARLVAEHYGFRINTSRVTRSTEPARTGAALPHLAAPLIQRYKPKG